MTVKYLKYLMADHEKDSDRPGVEKFVPCDPKEKVVEEVKIKVPASAISLDRKSNFRKSIGFVFLFLVLETNKQVQTYALTKSNGGKYPVPSALLVVLAEVFKLFFVLLFAQISGIKIGIWKPSIRFGLPAICYCLTNIMYLGALTYISPPIWMVLIQTRTLYTAAAYKIIFGREVTWVQGLGCVLVVCSISIARLSALSDGQSSISLTILLISQCCAILSTAASICVELLLKNDVRTFCEQQFWLYVWGSLIAAVFMLLREDMGVLTMQIEEVLHAWRLLLQLCGALVSTALAGLCVPVIVKNLDTIVKDYLSASNNLVLSVVTAIMFPGEFSLSWLYVLSLAILIQGIWLYEKKTFCRTT